MKINTPQWQTRELPVKDFAINGETVSCSNMDGSPLEFPLKDLIWCNKKGKQCRISYRAKVIMSGCAVKSVKDSKHKGFAEAKMPDGSVSLFNKRLNELQK